MSDDDRTDTPGTDQDEIDEDARLLGNEPDPEAVDRPTLDDEQEAQETYWMVKEIVAVGLVSIFGVLLLTFGLMQATGLVSLPDPIGNSPIAHWAVFVVLGVALIAAFAWSQWGT